MDRSLSDSVLLLLERHGISAPEPLRSALSDLLDAGLAPEFADPRSDERDTWAEPPMSVPAGPTQLPDRYGHVGVLGVGGMGQVLAVRDRTLGREVAMKVAHREMSAAGRTRFLAEAQVVAQLQHPGIVAIYDLGRLPQDEAYFTMPVVSGRTLTELIREVHAAVTPDGWQPGPSGVTFHRLITAFHAVADAIAYAHARGVVHRDLKPDNVIVGEHGVTVVVDWGLAKVLGTPDDLPLGEESGGTAPPVETYRTGTDGTPTIAGAVVGTLGYMPPEQARGELHRVDQRADVHALGATLYEILCGAPPFAAQNHFDALAQVIHDDAPPMLSPAPVPAEIATLALRCVAKEPEDRPADASVVAKTVNAWLEGANRRSKALAEVEAADAMLTEIDRLRATARALAEDADGALGSVAPHEPEERKRDGWRMQDRARAAEMEADLLEVKRVEALRGALRTDPELGEGHARLADHFRARHAAAEQRADVRRANELLHLLRTHDLQGAHAAYIEGSGRVTVVTDPPGAEVAAYRYEDRDRRRVAVPFARLGVTPIVDVRLPMGSYRLDLKHPERATARYPVLIERCTDWNGRPPGGAQPQPIRLLPRSDLGPHDRYVPSGWTWTGGDPEAEWPRPREVLWLDGFVMREHPVTNREYVAFLDALVAEGREDEAERHVPRDKGEPVHARDGAGRYVPRRDAQGDDWLPEFPVMFVDWRSACAYAAWEAERTGQPWRLPWELEREKAARGVDGRIHPWGDQYDPSWAWVRESHAGNPTPRAVDHPTNDVSPYGIRNLSGNALEWCIDLFRPTGPVIGDPDLGDTRTHRAFRGANWGSGARWCRASSRGIASPDIRESVLSFRLARSLA